MQWAFEYMETNKLILASDYPYTSGTTGQAGSCQASSMSTTNVQCTGYDSVLPNYPNRLLASIAKGPTSVAIEADKRVF